MRKMILAAALGALVAGGVANAGPINLRQANQERRIDAGLRSGKLTRAEGTRLKAEQKSIERLEARLKRDGRLSKADKARIESAQNLADRHILGQKADAQRGRNKLPI